MKLKQLFENNIPVYNGNISVPTHWKDLSGLPELYSGYTPGCHLDGQFYAEYCDKLTSLDGGPSSVNGDFCCDDCTSLTSLEGAPQSVTGNFFCNYCTSLTSLEGAPKSITKVLVLTKCTSLKKPILSIFKIKNLKKVRLDNTPVEEIVNKHLPNKDILECQEELIENGFKEYAKL